MVTATARTASRAISGHVSKVNVIIPMAGSGERFKKAGYTEYKPFIRVNGKYMIDHVLDAFPASMRKFIILDESLLSESNLRYLCAKENVVLIPIAPHKKGPAYSMLCANEKLPLNESFFVSYVDHYWTWDFAAVQKQIADPACDGVVYVKSTFHPHLIKDNFSAFCRLDSSDSTRVVEVREKGSFTDNWMTEPHSIGVYYFKSGFDMLGAIKKRIVADKRAAGEFYPSEAFNELIAQGKRICAFDVLFYIHWGVPEQLYDFERWALVTKNALSTQMPELGFTNICCMGGLGTRMKEISDTTPKALLAVCGKPMFVFGMSQFGSQKSIVLTVDSVAKQIPSATSGFTYEISNLGAQTKSQIETLTRAIPVLSQYSNFFLTSCDDYGIFDVSRFSQFVKEQSPDAVIFTFTPSLTKKKMSSQYTCVFVQGNRITDVKIKGGDMPGSSGLAGFFWFKDGSVFSELPKIPNPTGGELYADHFLKYLVDSKKKVCAFALDQYVHLGTVDEYKEFQYWLKYATVFDRYSK